MKYLSSIIVACAVSTGLFLNLCEVSGQQDKSILLDKNWEFVKGDLGGVWEALRNSSLSALPAWEKTSVPHCYNALDAVNPDVPYYQGPGWYRFYIPDSALSNDSRYILYFEGAGQKTDAWIYNMHVGSHTGGYDEFSFDITDAVADFRSDEELSNLFPGTVPLVVRCDNSRDLEMIPSDLSDFNLYGGLYRNVHLKVVPPVSIEKIHITPESDEKAAQARVNVMVDFYNPENQLLTGSLAWNIKSPDNKILKEEVINLSGYSANEYLFDIKLKNIEKWDVNNPSLYSIELSLNDASGNHKKSERFGFRNFYFEEHGPFYLNGRRLFLRGTHRHEDHAGYGQAMPEPLVRKELEMMKEMGVNFLRLGHYQQSEQVLDLCDELGILVWEEIPWCRGGLGGDDYQEQARRMLRNMISQHYNHPSVILWGLGNENDWPGDFSRFDQEKIRKFMTELHHLSHSLDPGRKTAIRRCDFCSDIIDVYSPSIWAGWYRGKYTEYYDVSREWNEKVPHFLHVEWGADMHAGRHAENPYKDLNLIAVGGGADERAGDFKLEGGNPRASKDGDWSETYGCDLIDWHLKEQEKMDWHTGTAQWPFKDFSTPLRPENPVPYVNQKGIVQRDLRKKEAFYLFQSYWTEKPMVHIYGHSWPVRWGAPGEKKLVRVYSNCPEVELFLNGTSVGRRKRDPENFPAAGLHWNLAFQAGENTLKATGTSMGEKVMDEITFTYQDKPWGEPKVIELKEYSRQNDTIRIEALLKDNDGLICLENSNLIHFSLAGEGTLIVDQGTYDGSGKVQLANGRASARVIMNGGRSVLSGKVEGIPAGFLSITGGPEAYKPAGLPSLLSYKTIDTTSLNLELFYPPLIEKDKQYPAIIFFFGGGWKGGTPGQFENHAKYFADRGMIAVLADYRVESRHGTTPFDAVSDAKSAIRFIRSNAGRLQIDAEKIAAAGGSAGGHLAAATATVAGLEDEEEDLTISSIPNALVLFNPVFDNGPDGYGYDRIGDRYREISPIHNIKPGTPPTIVFLGTDDRLIPVSTAERYKREMEKAGNRCDLFLYEGQKHGFFNYRHIENYYKTIAETDNFLISIDFLEKKKFNH